MEREEIYPGQETLARVAHDGWGSVLRVLTVDQDIGRWLFAPIDRVYSSVYCVQMQKRKMLAKDGDGGDRWEYTARLSRVGMNKDGGTTWDTYLVCSSHVPYVEDYDRAWHIAVFTLACYALRVQEAARFRAELPPPSARPWLTASLRLTQIAKEEAKKERRIYGAWSYADDRAWEGWEAGTTTRRADKKDDREIVYLVKE